MGLSPAGVSRASRPRKSTFPPPLAPNIFSPPCPRPPPLPLTPLSPPPPPQTRALSPIVPKGFPHRSHRGSQSLETGRGGEGSEPEKLYKGKGRPVSIPHTGAKGLTPGAIVGGLVKHPPKKPGLQLRFGAGARFRTPPEEKTGIRGWK